MDEYELDALADTALTKLGMNDREVLIAHLYRQIARDRSYLARRQQRGTHTPTDDAMATDCAVAALLIRFFQGKVEL